MPKTPRAFDPRSAAPVLFLTGPGIAGIPDCDLSANQLARIAWIRLGTERPDSPLDLHDKDIADLADDLVGSGSYSTEPATPAEPEATA